VVSATHIHERFDAETLQVLEELEDKTYTDGVTPPRHRYPTAHPREEHPLPLMVAAGARGGTGRVAWTGIAFGTRVLARHFG
jgi:aromatic ring-opening dioxygenase catalytic subunit (LigB family)